MGTVHPKLDLNHQIADELRFSVPQAIVAYPGEERDTMPELEHRQVLRMPMEATGPAAVEALEALRGEGCEYLVVPRTAFGWLEVSPALHERLEREYALVSETESAKVFSLHRANAADGAGRMGEDGLPLPPPSLIRMTVGGRRQALGNLSELYRTFWHTGKQGEQAIRDVLAGAGHAVEEMGSLLDFGCGVGRTLRHFHNLPGTQMHGRDYNPFLVEWCAENLPFAQFGTNRLRPPLDFEDDQFDLVYALSVFSHFDVETQLLWMDELSRVVRPGGLILITVPGERWLLALDDEDRERFLAGEPVILFTEQCGTNFCSALAPERHIRETLARGLDVLDIVVDGAPDVRQDAVLFQKPGNP